MKKLLLLTAIFAVAFAGVAKAAVSTDTVFSNNIPGDSIITNSTMFDADATPKYAVGTKVTMSDGREFRYAHFGADTNRGLLVAPDASESSNVSTSNIVVAPASAQTTTDGTINSKFVEVTLGSITANQFRGGYLHILDDTGEGYTYRIRSNTATGDPATGNIRIQLYDKLQVALDATTDIAIQGSPYANVEAATAATDTVVAGVSMSTMDVSEAPYGWIQVGGIATVLQDGAGITLGEAVTLSDGVAGAVQLLDTGYEVIVGHAAILGADGAHLAVKLNLE